MIDLDAIEARGTLQARRSLGDLLDYATVGEFGSLRENNSCAATDDILAVIEEHEALLTLARQQQKRLEELEGK